MNDQARVLRGLMDRRGEWSSSPRSVDARWPHAVVVTSGKGGVGTSVISLNLAVALAQGGSVVGLLDAAPGVGQIDLLGGCGGFWSLQHVLSGSRTVRQICVEGPAGVIVIPGASALIDLQRSPAWPQVAGQLGEVERSLDFLVVDAGSSSAPAGIPIPPTAQHVLLVTTPEPTAVAATYAVIKQTFRGLSESAAGLQILVNRAASPEQANDTLFRLQKTARLFLNWQPASAGWLPDDDAVRFAVAVRQPFLIADPDASVSDALRELACRVAKAASRSPRSESYFVSLPGPAVSTAA
jgi:flagellar biosynthesis protein FlhG